MDSKIVFSALFEKFGAVAIELEQAAPLFGYPTTAAASQAVLRETFPVKVRSAQPGGKRLVSLADIADWACGTQQLAQMPPKRGRGAPTKAERIKARLAAAMHGDARQTDQQGQEKGGTHGQAV